MSDVDIYFFPDFSAGNPQSAWRRAGLVLRLALLAFFPLSPSSLPPFRALPRASAAEWCAGQVDQVVSYLASYNVTNRSPYGPPHTYGMIWFDIEGPEYWGNPDDNVAFIQGCVGASARGRR